MVWKETAVLDAPSPGGGPAARLQPFDSVTWGPAKAEWTFTAYRLWLGERCLDGLFTEDLRWDDAGRLLAAVRCTNFSAGEGFWCYTADDWRPQQELVVIDLEGERIGRAAFDPAFYYTPKAFEGAAVVYSKTKHQVVGPIWEIEVALDAISDWRPLEFV